MLVEPTGTTSTNWSTSGTGFGVNAASGFTGNLIDAKVAGSSKFTVDASGNISYGGGNTFISMSAGRLNSANGSSSVDVANRALSDGVVGTLLSWSNPTVVVNPATSSDKAFIVRGLASQSGNLQEWQNSASSRLALIDASGNFGIGVATTSAKIHVVGTTEQLRLGYDASNYISHTVSSSGVLAYATSGTGSTPYFTFNKDATISGLVVGRGPGGVSTNTVFGLQALNSNTTGYQLTAIGYQAGFTMAGASNDNVAVGYQSLYTNNNYGNTAVGSESLKSSTGLLNVAVGYRAGYAIGAGNNNVFVGQQSGLALTSGGQNVFVGAGAGATYTSTSNTTAIGHQAINLSTGSANQAFGYRAGAAVTSGASNTYLGAFDGTGFETSSNRVFISDGDGNLRVHINNSGDMGIGTSTNTVSARIHAISTTEQLRLGYSTTAYTSFTVSSGSSLAIAPSSSTATVAIGNAASASSIYGMALGYSASVSANSAYALGREATASGTFALALGYASTTGNQYAAALTPVSTANFDYSVAIGYASSTTAASQIRLGTSSYNTSIPGTLTIGTQTSASAKAHIIATTEQLRLGYDASNYIQHTVSSTGVLAYATSGTGTTPYFTFNKDISIQSMTVGRGPGGVSTNTIVGNGAGAANTTGNQNVFVGYQVGASADSFGNVGLGYQAINKTTSGDSNIGIGYQATYNNTSGYSNIGIGAQALYNGAGSGFIVNIGIGTNAGRALSSGQHNVAIGYQALGNSASAATVSNSVAIGREANYNGSGNSVSVGYRALYNATTLAGSNNAFGFQAGQALTSGSGNTYLGSFDGTGFETSSDRVFISDGSGNLRIHVNNSGDMGIGTGTNTVSARIHAIKTTEQLRLGYDTSNYLSATVGSTGVVTFDAVGSGHAFSFSDDVTVVGSGTTCVIGTGTGATNCTSDSRLKQNVTNLGPSLDKVLALRPVTFQWNQLSGHEQTKIHTGFIAQEVQAVFPDSVNTVYGDYLGIDYASLTVPIVQAIQELDLQLKPLSDLDVSHSGSLAALIRSYLESVSNGIATIFANKIQTKQLCIEDVCVTKAQLQAILNQQAGGGSPQPPAPSGDSGAPSGDTGSQGGTGSTGSTDGSSSGSSGDTGSSSSGDNGAPSGDTGSTDAGTGNGGTGGDTTPPPASDAGGN